MERSTIIAALGPTNTGKTHRATTRLLEHESGMMGLPLRLLAREVYDKVRRQAGGENVALITGEEKLIPRRPRFFICTVEAMPLDRDVDFLAVDEIQLAAHPDRGHVFTHRLLHARGRVETWFMGSETMRPLIEQLVPTAQVRRFPRLSSLRAESSYTLGSLPRRSAVVAFSAARVYEVAEKLRARKGGAAVVLGALSPRARNAQVELYQNGEVDYLVATDAIGMGLNLDIDRVAFSETRKFDGHELRELELSELGQIAGRAGRHQRDGAFGTFERPPLPFAVSKALAEHRFPAVRRLMYRNHDLEFSSAQALLASLTRSPRHPALRLIQHAEDTETLGKLLHIPAVVHRLGSPDHVAALWDVCQIPDYRKLLVDEHARLAGELFVELTDHGQIRESFIRPRMERLQQHSGDIDAILDRIKAVRTWSYVTHQKGWVLEPTALQAQAAKIEDALSDDLNTALVERFVQRRRRSQLVQSASRKDRVHGQGDFKGRLAALYDQLQPPGPVSLVEQVLEAPDDELEARLDGTVTLRGTPVARLRPGQRPTEPHIVAMIQGGRKLQLRLDAWRTQHVERGLGAFLTRPHDGEGSALRGLLYQLRENYGCVSTQDVAALLGALDEKEARLLVGQGVVFGKVTTFVRAQLRPGALSRRLATVRVSQGNWPELLDETALDGTLWGRADLVGRPSMPSANLPGRLWLRVGYVRLGRSALRADIVEKVVTRGLAGEQSDLARVVATSSGMKKRSATEVARSLSKSGVFEDRPMTLFQVNPDT